ncbi:NRDE protein-domain-containing protein [Lipomyces oligophaga]|uniref:NRDE protein-domain-containing protein n=1 Tax=Lipomyces oligophaga TaxID=45792 RepID=UPI0034CFB665
MCILLLSTAHPKYPLVLLSNRDEYLNRPTQAAHFWGFPESDVLGPQDLARAEHGTWIGISKTGRLAILVNYREQSKPEQISPTSRGLLVKHFLLARESTAEWIENAIDDAGPEGLASVGGFSMVCGVLRRRSKDCIMHYPADAVVSETRLQPLGVLTNRSLSLHDGTSWIFDPERSPNPTITTDEENPARTNTFGISNSLYTEPWPKVRRGCDLLAACIQSDVKLGSADEDKFIEELFKVLSTDELPREEEALSVTKNVFDQLKQSIKIPVFSVVDGLLPDISSDCDLTLSTGETSTADSWIPNHDTATSTGLYTFVKGKYYGTRTQTVILVTNEGHVKYVERNIDGSCAGNQQISEFDIDGWI